MPEPDETTETTTTAPAETVAETSTEETSTETSETTDANEPAVDPEIAELRAKVARLEASDPDQAARLERATEEHRNVLLDRLGVLEKFRDFAPKVDPYTAEGKAKLDAWAQDNTELLAARRPQTDGIDETVLKPKKPGVLFDANVHREALHAVRRSRR
jgi:hypothetical protein